jgi:hypothetical protein
MPTSPLKQQQTYRSSFEQNCGEKPNPMRPAHLNSLGSTIENKNKQKEVGSATT